MMFTNLLLAVITAFSMSTTAAIVRMYRDKYCADFISERNIWDNTCAPETAFSSWQIVARGGGGQYIRSYSTNHCAGTAPVCQDAQDFEHCHVAVGENDGASNAFGSSAWPCA
jgi:hypothetical protein